MLGKEGFTLWMPALHSILHQVRSPSDDVALNLALKEQHIQQDASLALTDSLVLPKTPGMQLSSGALPGIFMALGSILNTKQRPASFQRQFKGIKMHK